MSVKYLDNNDIKGSASKIRISLESLLKKRLLELKYQEDISSLTLGKLFHEHFKKVDNEFFNQIQEDYKIISDVGNKGSHEDKSLQKTELNIAHCISALESLFYIISIYIKKYKDPDFKFEKALSSDYKSQIFNLAIKIQSKIYERSKIWDFSNILFAPSITADTLNDVKKKYKKKEFISSDKTKLVKGFSLDLFELPLLVYRYSLWGFSKGFLLTNDHLRGSNGSSIFTLDISKFEIHNNLILVNDEEISIFKEEIIFLFINVHLIELKLSEVLTLFFEELIRINSLAKENKPITINLDMNNLFYGK